MENNKIKQQKYDDREIRGLGYPKQRAQVDISRNKYIQRRKVNVEETVERPEIFC